MQDLISEIDKQFELKAVDASQYSPLALAYIGDNIYELINRTTAVKRANKQSQKLHKECSARANARTQAQMALLLEQELTEEEAAVYRRGRNAAVNTKAKNASITEYHEATGLEALIGFLYLTGQYARLTELIRTGWEKIEQNET